MIYVDAVLSDTFHKCLSDFPIEERLKTILECSYMSKPGYDRNDDLYDVERHARRLCFVLNTERHKILLQKRRQTRSIRAVAHKVINYNIIF